jgi:hypothetical protein
MSGTQGPKSASFGASRAENRPHEAVISVSCDIKAHAPTLGQQRNRRTS